MRTQQFEVSKYLEDDAMIAEYLRVALAENDTGYFMQTLGNIAKARGMTQIASDTGLSRESLYRALSGDTHPRIDTVSKILHSIGFSLDVNPEASV